MEDWRPSVPEELYARVLGEEVLKFVKNYDQHRLAREVDTAAVRALAEIQKILNDSSLDDPECFHRIDAIVQVLQDNGISTSRHDF